MTIELPPTNAEVFNKLVLSNEVNKKLAFIEESKLSNKQKERKINYSITFAVGDGKSTKLYMSFVPDSFPDVPACHAKYAYGVFDKNMKFLFKLTNEEWIENLGELRFGKDTVKLSTVQSMATMGKVYPPFFLRPVRIEADGTKEGFEVYDTYMELLGLTKEQTIEMHKMLDDDYCRERLSNMPEICEKYNLPQRFWIKN